MDEDGYGSIGQDKPVPPEKEVASEQDVEVCPVHAPSISQESEQASSANT